MGLEMNSYSLAECNMCFVLVCEHVYVCAFECVCLGLFCACVHLSVWENVCVPLSPCVCLYVGVHTVLCLCLCVYMCM